MTSTSARLNSATKMNPDASSTAKEMKRERITVTAALASRSSGACLEARPAARVGSGHRSGEDLNSQPASRRIDGEGVKVEGDQMADTKPDKKKMLSHAKRGSETREMRRKLRTQLLPHRGCGKTRTRVADKDLGGSTGQDAADDVCATRERLPQKKCGDNRPPCAWLGGVNPKSGPHYQNLGRAARGSEHGAVIGVALLQRSVSHRNQENREEIKDEIIQLQENSRRQIDPQLATDLKSERKKHPGSIAENTRTCTSLIYPSTEILKKLISRIALLKAVTRSRSGEGRAGYHASCWISKADNTALNARGAPGWVAIAPKVQTMSMKLRLGPRPNPSDSLKSRNVEVRIEGGKGARRVRYDVSKKEDAVDVTVTVKRRHIGRHQRTSASTVRTGAYAG
ncbi:hypothetical protein B0H11DRAFT_1936977 [Mycena galericulata]|nr:hypothetical protein B0H11DRAFT_1936977 [Mycena galericulata]